MFSKTTQQITSKFTATIFCFKMLPKHWEFLQKKNCVLLPHLSPSYNILNFKISLIKKMDMITFVQSYYIDIRKHHFKIKTIYNWSYQLVYASNLFKWYSSVLHWHSIVFKVVLMDYHGHENYYFSNTILENPITNKRSCK